jgi:hypothetical protein
MSERARRALAAAIAMFGCLAVTATASASTVYVSNSSPAVVGGKSCAQPDYGTVQAGIDAAKGGTVNICPGTYTEQIEISGAVKLTAVSGVGTATLAMPAEAANSKSSCDTKEGLEQKDEISICTSGTVTMTGLDVEAIIPLATCQYGLYGIFIGDGGTLKATGDTIDGASTSLNADKGCQHGVAVEVGSKTPAEIGHATLKGVTVEGYEKNGPTVKSPGSTLSISGSTITGEGSSPYIAQNGVEVAYGGTATIKSSTVSGNECSIETVCGARAEQASGVLFYAAGAGSSLTSSTVRENDLGVYYASGKSFVPASAEVAISKDVLTSNRYEGVLLEEGKASLKSDTINGSGRVGIDLYQASYQTSASESSASSTKISGQAEAAIEVESDKEPSDIAGKFLITKTTATGNGSLLINESSNFEVIV